MIGQQSRKCEVCITCRSKYQNYRFRKPVHSHRSSAGCAHNVCTNTRAMNSWMLSPKPTTSASATESMSSRRLNLRKERKNTDGWRMLQTSKHEDMYQSFAFIQYSTYSVGLLCAYQPACDYLYVHDRACLWAPLANATVSNGHSMADVWKLMSNMIKWPAHSKEAVTFWQGILSRRGAMGRKDERDDKRCKTQ